MAERDVGALHGIFWKCNVGMKIDAQANEKQYFLFTKGCIFLLQDSLRLLDIVHIHRIAPLTGTSIGLLFFGGKYTIRLCDISPGDPSAVCPTINIFA